MPDFNLDDLIGQETVVDLSKLKTRKGFSIEGIYDQDPTFKGLYDAELIPMKVGDTFELRMKGHEGWVVTKCMVLALDEENHCGEFEILEVNVVSE